MTGDGTAINGQTGHQTGQGSKRTTTSQTSRNQTSRNLSPWGMSVWALILAACHHDDSTMAGTPAAARSFLHSWTHTTKYKSEITSRGDTEYSPVVEQRHYSYGINENETVVITVAALMRRLGLEGNADDWNVEILGRDDFPAVEGIIPQGANTDVNVPADEGALVLAVLGEGENKYLGFTRDGSATGADFESPEDVSQNNVYYVVVRFTSKEGGQRQEDRVLHISVQDVVEGGETDDASYTNSLLGTIFDEAGVLKLDPSSEVEPEFLRLRTDGIDAPNDIVSVQSLKADNLLRYFRPPPELNSTKKMTVLSGTELMVEYFDEAGATIHIYVFSLRSVDYRFNVSDMPITAEKVDLKAINELEFVHKGRDSAGDEIVDIQFTAAQLETFSTSNEVQSFSFHLYVNRYFRQDNGDVAPDNKFNTSSDFSSGWDDGYTFKVNVAARAPEAGGRSTSVNDRAMNVVEYDDQASDDISSLDLDVV